MGQITTAPDGTQIYYNNGQAINAKTGANYAPASPATTTPIGTPAPSVTAQPTQPTVQPTVLSSDKSSVIADNNARLAQHTNSGTYTDQAGFLRYNDDTSLVQAPMDATPNGSGAWEAGGMTYGGSPQFIPGDDPETQAQNKIIGMLMTSTDSNTRQQISSITNQYNQLIAQQQASNASQSDSINQTLLQGGSSRYAPISSAGVVAATTSYGLQKIASLVAEEQGLIQTARTAQASGNQQALQKALDEIDKTKAAKQAAAQTVSANLAKANADLASKKLQQTTDAAIAQLYSAGTTDPSKIVASLNAQGITVTAKDVGDAIKALYPATTKDLPASAQEYEYAKTQGYTGTYTQYQNDDANRKAVKIAAPAGSKPISLTNTDRQSLLGAGLNQSEIANIEADVNAHGLQAVLAGISNPAQKTAVQKAYSAISGASSTATQFLTTDYLSNLFGDKALEKAANDAGYQTGGFLGFGESGDKTTYLSHLMSMVNQYRQAGYTDQDILKMLQ